MVTVLLSCLLAIMLSGDIVNAKKAKDDGNNGVPAFGVLKKYYMNWWESKAKKSDFTREQLEKFNKLNQGEKNKYLKAIFSEKTAKDFFSKLNEVETLPENKKVPIGEEGAYLLVNSSIEKKKGQKINDTGKSDSLNSLSADGEYTYRYFLKAEKAGITFSEMYVKVFVTIKDGNITANGATGGSENIWPFLAINDGVSSAFVHGDRAIGNQPFEAHATFLWGAVDLEFISKTINLFAWVDKYGNKGGWHEPDPLSD